MEFWIKVIFLWIILIILWILGIFFLRYIILSMIKKHRRQQIKKLKFLQIKIPQKFISKQTDLDANDHIQNMKQNIDIMNQVYKNLYSIYEDKFKYKFLGQNYLSLEISIEKEIIKFVLAVPKEHVGTVEKTIWSFYPGAVVNRIKQTKLLDAGKYIEGGEIILKKTSVYPIKTYETFEADPMDSILSSYSKVLSEEKMCLQILCSPLDEKWLKKLREKVDAIKKWKHKFFLRRWLKSFRRNVVNKGKEENPDEESMKFEISQQQMWDMDKKFEDELFYVQIKAIAISPDSHRPHRLIEDLVSSFNQYNYSGMNSFKFEKEYNINNFARDFVERRFYSLRRPFRNFLFIKKRTLLNIKELSSIIHFPHSRFNKHPRLSWQKYKVVPAPENLPTEWMLIGYNDYAGIKKEVRLQDEDRFRHVYIIGQTGTGKTTLMLLQAINDIKNGNGMCYIDPHGDACEDILSHIPKDRIDDLIYFDLSNTEYPIGFNPLEADSDDERDIITNDLVEMFVNMYWPEIFGPRIQDYFRNACFLLMEQPEWWTMVELVRLFTDDAFAESKIRNVKNPIILSRWNKTYKKMGDREKAEAIPFFQAKFWQFTTGTYVRNIVGQPKSSFNIYQAMQEKKIILCNLSKGLAGEVNSQLVWRMLTMQIKLAALKRAKIGAEDRVPYFLYIDEFQNYVSKSIESVLSEARKYKLWLTIAHQYIEQLKQSWLSWKLDLSTAIFGNVGTIFSLKVGAPDAEFLEKEFTPEFSQSDLINMDKFKWVMKMSINFQQSRPFSFAPIYRGNRPIVNTKEKIEIIKQISALKRWTKRELVDKEIYFRVGV